MCKDKYPKELLNPRLLRLYEEEKRDEAAVPIPKPATPKKTTPTVAGGTVATPTVAEGPRTPAQASAPQLVVADRSFEQILVDHFTPPAPCNEAGASVPVKRRLRIDPEARVLTMDDFQQELEKKEEEMAAKNNKKRVNMKKPAMKAKKTTTNKKQKKKRKKSSSEESSDELEELLERNDEPRTSNTKSRKKQACIERKENNEVVEVITVGGSRENTSKKNKTTEAAEVKEQEEVQQEEEVQEMDTQAIGDEVRDEENSMMSEVEETPSESSDVEIAFGFQPIASSTSDESEDETLVDEVAFNKAHRAKAMSNPQPDKYYMVSFGKELPYIGKVVTVGTKILMKFLKRSCSDEYIWPVKDQLEEIDRAQIVCGPIKISGSLPFVIKGVLKAEKMFRAHQKALE